MHGLQSRKRALWSMTAIAAAIVLGLSACAPPGGAGDTGGGSGGQVTADAPQGVVDEAFQIGEGAVLVDLYTDASCPHCRDFDAEAAEELQARIDAGEITYRLHPMNYVSQKRGDDSDFSTRVMNLLAVASDHGQVDAVPAVYSALVAAQAPTLDEAMPDDAELIELAQGAGLEVDDEMRGEIESGAWADWVQGVNDRAVGQPIGDTGETLTGVPTLLVDGTRFDILEDGTDLARLQAALDGAAG